jgi:ATP-dependent DNA ligase
MPLARFDAPFDHPDWIFEPKMDGFRAVAYVEGGTCRLVSRNRNAFKTFEALAIAQDLPADVPSCHPGRRDRASRAGWQAAMS